MHNILSVGLLLFLATGLIEEAFGSCSIDEVLCKGDSGKCVKNARVCTGKKKPDCPDGSDEMSWGGFCEDWNCLDGHIAWYNDDFLNKGKTCIPKVATLCNGTNGKFTPLEISRNCRSFDCLDGYMKCDDTMQCISLNVYKRCDGKSDCNDGSDEIACEYIKCLNGVKCKDGKQCRPHESECNGNYDCNDHSDEFDCDFCRKGGWLCKKNHQCVNKTMVCDGKDDCDDYSDENDCDEVETDKPKDENEDTDTNQAHDSDYSHGGKIEPDVMILIIFKVAHLFLSAN